VTTLSHADGTVEWHSVGEHAAKKTAKETGAQKQPRQRDAVSAHPAYADEKIADGVRDGSTVGIEYNAKTWMPVHGRFEVIHCADGQLTSVAPSGTEAGYGGGAACALAPPRVNSNHNNHCRGF
jgi:hypothetical protein